MPYPVFANGQMQGLGLANVGDDGLLAMLGLRDIRVFEGHLVSPQTSSYWRMRAENCGSASAA